MKRALAILLLLVTLVGWLRVTYGEERVCCCGSECACQVQVNASEPACPCNCGDEQKELEEMPLTLAEWPEAVTAPELRTPVPPVLYRDMKPEERPLTVTRRLGHAPPGMRSGSQPTLPEPYAGYHTPLRA